MYTSDVYSCCVLYTTVEGRNWSGFFRFLEMLSLEEQEINTSKMSEGLVLIMRICLGNVTNLSFAINCSMLLLKVSVLL